MGCCAAWAFSPPRSRSARAASTEVSMVLRGLQSLLGRLYDVELNYDVYDYLVTDRREVAGGTDAAAAAAHDVEEELLLAETPDGAGVALYLDPGLLRRLERADPV